MDNTMYSLMLDAFKPYLLIIIALLVIIAVALCFIMTNTNKTNQLLSSLIDSQDNEQEKE